MLILGQMKLHVRSQEWIALPSICCSRADMGIQKPSMREVTVSWKCLRVLERPFHFYPWSYHISSIIQSTESSFTAHVSPHPVARSKTADWRPPGTMSEIEKALHELKKLMEYREDQLGHKEDFRGLGLTSRKNLCLHPSVKREKSGAVVDARCRSLTAGFVKEKKERGEDVPVCIYHDVCHRSTSEKP